MTQGNGRFRCVQGGMTLKDEAIAAVFLGDSERATRA
jgi:hypothetical protein